MITLLDPETLYEHTTGESSYERLAELRQERETWLRENPGRFLEPNDPRDAARWSLAYPDEADELAELAELLESAGECTDHEDTAEVQSCLRK